MLQLHRHRPVMLHRELVSAHSCLPRQDERSHLFQPAWLIRRLIHRLDQVPASFSHQLQNTEPLG